MSLAVPVFVPVSFLGIRRHIPLYPIKAGSWHYMKSGVAAPIPASPTTPKMLKMRGKSGVLRVGECARFVPVGERGPRVSGDGMRGETGAGCGERGEMAACGEWGGARI